MYKFPVPRAGKKVDLGDIEDFEAEIIDKYFFERGVFYRGIWVASKEEWWFINALEELKVTFDYQVKLAGGRSRRGGFVVDFVCYSPLSVAVELQSHWHENEFGADDHLKDAIMRKQYNRVVYMWPSDWQNAKTGQEGVDAAKKFIRNKVL